MEPESDRGAGLLEACKAGDRRALGELFDGRAAQLYRWGVLLGLPPADAEDAAQEVFAIAARRIDSCPGPDALTAWLFQIARRVVANARRRNWYRSVLRRDTPAPAFEHDSSADLERELAVRSCLSRLPRAQVEVLLLMDVEGHSREETARILGIPLGTVASRRRLGCVAFKRCWEEQFDSSAPFAFPLGAP